MSPPSPPRQPAPVGRSTGPPRCIGRPDGATLRTGATLTRQPPQALPTREQPVGGIETFRLLRIGRPRHLSYAYYLLRRKSSTQRERSRAITRSKQKLPFAFGE